MYVKIYNKIHFTLIHDCNITFILILNTQYSAMQKIFLY